MKKKPIIVHSVPFNSSICGGMKVHYQLSELENELGYNSFIVYDSEQTPSIDWFSHGCKELTLSSLKDYLVYNKTEVSLVIGYEDISSIDKLKDVAENFVIFVQGPQFYDVKNHKDNIRLWYNSLYARNQCKISGNIVRPYISDEFDYRSWQYSFDNKRFNLLVQKRKKGEKAIEDVLSYLDNDVLSHINVTVLSDCPEHKFIDALHNCDIFFAHSYPEGLGLPPLEAMRGSKIVVGYSGGGGSDFMINTYNCFVSPDGDAKAVAGTIKRIIVELSPEELQIMSYRAYTTSLLYNKLSTIKDLKLALKESDV